MKTALCLISVQPSPDFPAQYHPSAQFILIHVACFNATLQQNSRLFNEIPVACRYKHTLLIIHILLINLRSFIVKGGISIASTVA